MVTGSPARNFARKFRRFCAAMRRGYSNRLKVILTYLKNRKAKWRGRELTMISFLSLIPLVLARSQ